MHIDIVPIENNNKGYRGIDRLLNIDCFYIKKGFQELLDMYFDYISYIMDEEDNRKVFCRILPFYHKLIDIGANCEIIVYDTSQIRGLYGNKVIF